MTSGRTWSIVVVLGAATGLYVMTAFAHTENETAPAWSELTEVAWEEAASSEACQASECTACEAARKRKTAAGHGAPVEFTFEFNGHHPLGSPHRASGREERSGPAHPLHVGPNGQLVAPWADSHEQAVVFASESACVDQANSSQTCVCNSPCCADAAESSREGPVRHLQVHRSAPPAHGPGVEAHVQHPGHAFTPAHLHGRQADTHDFHNNPLVALMIENARLKTRQEMHEHLTGITEQLLEQVVTNARLSADLEAAENRHESLSELVEVSAEYAAMEAKLDVMADWRDERDELLGQLMESMAAQAVQEARLELHGENSDLRLRVAELEREVEQMIAARDVNSARSAQVSSRPEESSEADERRE